MGLKSGAIGGSLAVGGGLEGNEEGVVFKLGLDYGNIDGDSRGEEKISTVGGDRRWVVGTRRWRRRGVRTVVGRRRVGGRHESI